MSRPSRISWPLRAVSGLLALLIALALTSGCAALLARSLLTSVSLHESVALDSRVTDAQMARITARVDELAGRYSFAPESVLSVVTRDSVAAYAREVVAWGLGLMEGAPVPHAPVYPASAIEAAVRADGLFQASVPAVRQRTVARDNVAYEVSRTVERAVLPLRTELITLALPILLERVDLPLWLGRLAKLPLVCAGAALGLALGILLLLHARLDKAALTLGAALAGAALTVLGLLALVPLLGLGSMAAELSGMLALQLQVLYARVALRALPMALPLLAGGIALILVHQHSGRAKA